MRATAQALAEEGLRRCEVLKLYHVLLCIDGFYPSYKGFDYVWCLLFAYLPFSDDENHQYVIERGRVLLPYSGICLVV
jgi:hypothetical protein